MRRQDKYKNMVKANLMMEQSYLKKKSLLNESFDWIMSDGTSFNPDEEREKEIRNMKYSFEGKWNKVPEENKNVLDKSTGTDVGLIYATSNTNYAIGEKDGKYYLYNFRKAENPGEPIEFNSIEDAKNYVTK